MVFACVECGMRPAALCLKQSGQAVSTQLEKECFPRTRALDARGRTSWVRLVVGEGVPSRTVSTHSLALPVPQGPCSEPWPWGQGCPAPMGMTHRPLSLSGVDEVSCLPFFSPFEGQVH